MENAWCGYGRNGQRVAFFGLFFWSCCAAIQDCMPESTIFDYSYYIIGTWGGMAVNWAHINTHDAGQRVAWHSHADTEVVVYLRGRGTVSMDGSRFEYGQRSFTVAPLGTRHNLEPQSATESLCLLLSGYRLESYRGVWKDAGGLIREAGLRIVRECAARQAGFREICDGLGGVVAGLVQRAASISGDTSRERRTVNHAVAIIDKLQGATGVSAVARELCVSTSHLRHLFARHAPMPAVAYIQRSRIDRARGLLLATDLPLAEIARQCGFTTLPYFSRSFKRATGVAPRLFRVSGGAFDTSKKQSWVEQ